MNCLKCNRNLRDDSKFCDLCGEKVEPSDTKDYLIKNYYLKTIILVLSTFGASEILIAITLWISYFVKNITKIETDTAESLFLTPVILMIVCFLGIPVIKYLEKQKKIVSIIQVLLSIMSIVSFIIIAINVNYIIHLLRVFSI